MVQCVCIFGWAENVQNKLHVNNSEHQSRRRDHSHLKLRLPHERREAGDDVQRPAQPVGQEDERLLHPLRDEHEVEGLIHLRHLLRDEVGPLHLLGRHAQVPHLLVQPAILVVALELQLRVLGQTK